jgi:hypothetical protein
MTRYLAAFTTAVALAIALPAAAQTATAPTTKPHAQRHTAKAPAPSPVTLTGCVAAGEQPNGFSLSVISTDTSAAATQPSTPSATGTTGTTPTAAPSISQGSHVQLIGDTTSLAGLVNRKVQVTGMIVPPTPARAHGKAASAAAANATSEAATQVRVQRIERLADSCEGGTPKN